MGLWDILRRSGDLCLLTAGSLPSGDLPLIGLLLRMGTRRLAGGERERGGAKPNDNLLLTGESCLEWDLF